MSGLRGMKGGNVTTMWKEGKHYLSPDRKGKPYLCLRCERHFESQYFPRQQQLPGKVCGTEQLLGLWAWSNFKRHLNKCWEIKATDERKDEK